MSKEILAVPSELPGGLGSPLSGHFGRAPMYTIVEINDGQATLSKVLQNTGHEAGGCLAPVQFLAAMGVTAIAAGGMGARPLAGFQENNIKVFSNGGVATVSEVVELFRQGGLREFSLDNVCGGGCSH